HRRMKTKSKLTLTLKNARKPNVALSHAIRACLIASLGAPVLSVAQQEPEVEEVVVTGSYIRNSAFAQNSPVETVTQEDLQVSGAPNMSQYIRDMTYTQ